MPIRHISQSHGEQHPITEHQPEAASLARTTPQQEAPPGLLAEEVPIGVLYDALNSGVSKDDSDSYPGDQDLIQGGLCIEIGLHPETSPERAENFFEKSVGHLEQARDNQDAELGLRIEAGLLVADLPFFVARKFDDDVSDNAINSVRQEIADLRPIYGSRKDASGYPGLLVKVGLHELILRSGVIAYASTLRESRGSLSAIDSPQTQHPQLHSSYMVEDGVKIPMRASHTRQSKSNEFAIQIALAPLIANAVRQKAPDMMSAYDTRLSLSEEVIGWSLDEAYAPLDDTKKTILDYISNTILEKTLIYYPDLES